METITLPKSLRLFGRDPPARKTTINKADISDPIVDTWTGPQAYEWLPTVPAGPRSSNPSFIAASSLALKVETRFKAPEIDIDDGEVGISSGLLQVIGEIQNSNPYTETESQEIPVASNYDARSKAPHFEGNNEDIDTSLQRTVGGSQSRNFDSQREFEHCRDVPKTRWHIELTSTEPSHPNPFLSAVPLDEEISNDPEIFAPASFVKVYNILCLAATLFEFKTTSILIEAR